MVDKNVKIIFLLSLVPFLLYFFSTSFVDGDSYFYLSGVCFGTSLAETDLLTIFLLPFLPCNPFFLKVLQFLLFFGCSLVLYYMIKSVTSKNEWLPYLIAGSFLALEFMKLENDLTGYFFGFLGIYFLINHKKIFALASFCIGFGFWFGVAYWIALLPLWSIWFTPILLLVIYFKEKFLWFLNANTPIIEHAHWLGFLQYGFCLPFIYVGLLTKTDKRILTSFLLLVTINVFVGKLWVLALPFGLIIANNGVNYLLKTKHAFFVQQFLKISGIVFAVFLMQHAITQPFTMQDEALIQQGVKLACEKNDCWIQNDFSAGHTIKYFGGKTLQHSGVTSYDYNNIVIDIKRNQTPNHCKKLATSTYFSLLEC